MSDFQKFLDEALGNVMFENDFTEELQRYDITKEVRELVRSTRNRSGISQKELAEKSGITQVNISKIENGHAVPTLPVLKRLADAMGKRLVVDFADKERNI